MSVASPLLDHVDPVIRLVPDSGLKQALKNSFAMEAESVAKIERFFARLPEQKWSQDLLSCVFNSWKATHLKMLAIYGLSCRLQRLADSAINGHELSLLSAAAKNAETSHEDLGLDFDGHTHADLYDSFAGTFVAEDWQLKRHRLDSASRFSKWVYRNMVVEDIQVGLFTNMFSEIYNHGEYSTALPSFNAYVDNHCDLGPKEKARALMYISAHIEDETEIAHFQVVLDSLDLYLKGTDEQLNYELAERVFRQYLKGVAPVMQELTERMSTEA
ncbi:MAG: hypothetical protein DHS20C11_15020 [Lysobacteraceae bacterium]|nr:MAG: hypothetical protein DHS20C11_15020 [Xanthomonadaceae bacterium]